MKRFLTVLLILLTSLPLLAAICYAGASGAPPQIRELAKPYELSSSNGYIVYSGTDGRVQTMVQDVNAKRRAQYQKIANKHGKTLSDVEALAQKKIEVKSAKADGTYSYTEEHTKKLLDRVPAGVQEQIKAGCKSEYPTDYSMQASCVRNQAKGWLSVN